MTYSLLGSGKDTPCLKQSRGKSEIQDDIVKQLYEKKTMRFTELRKELKVSKPVLSYHLSILKDKNIIEFTQKGREKHYQLNEKSPKTFETKIKELYLKYETHVNFLDTDPDEDSTKTVEWLSSIIGCIYLFYMLKSIETGRDWVKNIELGDFRLFVFRHLFASITESKEPDYLKALESSEDDNQFYNKIKKTILKNDAYREKLKTLIGHDIEFNFPDAMSIIKQKCKEVGI